jgi:hypothetical protein
MQECQRFGLVVWSIFFLDLCLPRVATALTSPHSGCAAKPADFNISAPFAAGERVYITSGYGPYQSPFHDNCNLVGYMNEYHALDMVLIDHANGGQGEPVLAVESGTVLWAGMGTGTWAGFGNHVYIQHDYNADGHTYFSVYAHLMSLAVSTGQHVDKGQQLGPEDSTGNVTGPHVHFMMMQDATWAQVDSGGLVSGHSMVPEPMDGYEDLAYDVTIVSANGGQVTPCFTIPQNAETVLEDDGPCFFKSGTAAYWHSENSGNGGHCLWTYASDAAQPDNQGFWKLFFAAPGEYQLSAYVPADFGKSKQAKYVVKHQDQQKEVVLDQSANPNAWVALGKYAFAGEGDQWVHLTDNTGEKDTTKTQIVFDALKVSPVTEPAKDSGDVPDAGQEKNAVESAGSENEDAGETEETNGGVEGCSCASRDFGASVTTSCWLLSFLLYHLRRKRFQEASK